MILDGRSKARMNLAAIKKVDPYAKDICWYKKLMPTFFLTESDEKSQIKDVTKMILDGRSKAQMNLAAIKKVDPYAKDIVDTSSHVAFYTFNADHNEWEKTDVEGAFFIYSRNEQPFHSIFINNRINTTSFVEPITSQLELQSQPPFLLYRNERSRIRGFWFNNSEECDRIRIVVGNLVHKVDANVFLTESDEKSQIKDGNVNIFKMLSKAQQECVFIV